MAKKRTTRKTTKKPSATTRTAKKRASKKRVARTSPAGKESSKAAKGKAASGTPKSAGGRSRLPKQVTSPDFSGKPKKLDRDQFPNNAAAKDFKCFGPPATEDGDFESARICDLGCFTQDGKDSNKYYHGSVVQHRKSKNWFAYFEWGRTGGSSCSFQFVACAGEEDARAYFAKRLHEKNDKRGEWVDLAGIRTLRAKKGKDCYLVRPMAKRTTGLPDAQNITSGKTVHAKSKSASLPKGDPKTRKLLRELSLATIAYTRTSLADSSIPSQKSINEARQILSEAEGRVSAVGTDVDDQVNDKQLMRLTSLMMSRIPRKKKVGACPTTWMLTGNNIIGWQDDLDAFESAIQGIQIEMNPNFDLLADMNLDMQWVDPNSNTGQFLHGWFPNASAHRHEKIQEMAVQNIWSLKQNWTGNRLHKAQQRILKANKTLKHKARFQPRSRKDLNAAERRVFRGSNTALLFHGTRGVNVSAILRDALRMPDTLVAVALTGAKFGPGIYFADDWKKSANYANVKGSAEAGANGRVKRRHGFMFLADVVLGQPHLAPKIHGYTKPPRGCHSVLGKAGHSGVDDNEYVVFKPDQCELRYLVEFKVL